MKFVSKIRNLCGYPTVHSFSQALRVHPEKCYRAEGWRSKNTRFDLKLIPKFCEELRDAGYDKKAAASLIIDLILEEFENGE